MTIDIEAAKQRARKAQERAGKATAEPWWPKWYRTGRDNEVDAWDIGDDEAVNNIANGLMHKGNAAFIAAARTDVPALAADVLELVERVEELEESRIRLRSTITDAHSLLHGRVPNGMLVSRIEALIDETVRARAEAGGEATRLHTLAEGLALATRNLLAAGDRAGLGMTEDGAMDEASAALAAFDLALVALDAAVKA